MIPAATRSIGTQCDLAPIAGEGPSVLAPRRGCGDTQRMLEDAAVDVFALLNEANRVVSKAVARLQVVDEAIRNPPTLAAVSQRRHLAAHVVDEAARGTAGVLDMDFMDDNPFGPQVLNEALMHCDGDDSVNSELKHTSPESACDAAPEETQQKEHSAFIPPLQTAHMRTVGSNCSLGSWAYVYTPRTPTSNAGYHSRGACDESVSSHVSPVSARTCGGPVLRLHAGDVEISRQSSGSCTTATVTPPLSPGAARLRPGHQLTDNRSSSGAPHHACPFPCSLLVDPTSGDAAGHCGATTSSLRSLLPSSVTMSAARVFLRCLPSDALRVAVDGKDYILSRMIEAEGLRDVTAALWLAVGRLLPLDPLGSLIQYGLTAAWRWGFSQLTERSQCARAAVSVE